MRFLDFLFCWRYLKTQKKGGCGKYYYYRQDKLSLQLLL